LSQQRELILSRWEEWYAALRRVDAAALHKDAVMAKRQTSSVLNRLAGKKLVFNGKFTWGVEDQLKALAQVQQGKVVDDLDDKVDYLVLADLNAGKTIQKKAMTLNGKGAAIQVIDVDAFNQLAEPTEADILAALHAGQAEEYGKICRVNYYHIQNQPPKYTFCAEDFSDTAFKVANLTEIRFESCNFSGAQFEQATFRIAKDCDFSKVTAKLSPFGDVSRSKFCKATLTSCRFEGEFSEADFSGAALETAEFRDQGNYGFGHSKKKVVAPIFAKAKLPGATFQLVQLKSPDFSGADLTKASLLNCLLEAASFRDATLKEASLLGSTVKDADFSKADLTGANLAGVDLTGAKFDGANLKNANLRGAKLDGVDLSKAKNYEPSATVGGSIGASLTELDNINAKAKRIHVTFRLRSADGATDEQVGIDSSGLRYGWGIQAPQNIASRHMLYSGKQQTFSQALLQLANSTSHLRVAYETVDVSSTKSPTGGKELRELVLSGIAEAYAQELPAEEELAAATKKRRETQREAGAAAREQREQAKAAAEKEKAKAKKQIAKKIEKAVGKVNDVASFLKALEVRIEKPKIDKATKMLKASGFKLFNDITEQDVCGVVKSQTDPDLVYACRVMHDGQYSCCTQNLNVCGGLRGSICKHLLVLIIGLVQAGELDPTTIDAWIAKTHSVKPELDKEVMGAIFIKYKGAEAGEVDWRPTETVPEDYYTL